MTQGSAWPLHEGELEWFVKNEWARTTEDVLVRRTKHVLHADAGLRERLDTWLRERLARDD